MGLIIIKVFCVGVLFFFFILVDSSCLKVFEAFAGFNRNNLANGPKFFKHFCDAFSVF